MPPPFAPVPLAIVRPLMVAVALVVTWKIRNAPLDRCTTNVVAPGPLIVTLRVRTSSPLVNPIGLTTEPMLKVIVLAVHASASACRRLPAPLSAFVVTTGFVVHGLFTWESGLLVLGAWLVPPR